MEGAVLITGAATGFGSLTARLAHQRGWKVAATARRPERVASPQEARERWLVLALDVTDEGSVKKAVAAAIERFGSLSAVVNNAGISTFCSAEEEEEEALRDVLETNFFGAARVTRELLPHFRARGAGRVVFVSSQWGRTGVPGFSAYCASKFALEGYAEALFQETAPQGIAVTLVEPGAFDTGFGARSLSVSPKVTDPRSPYRRLYRALGESFARESNPTGEPVAEAILDVLSAPAPPLRVVVGEEARAWSEARFRPEEEAFLGRLAREKGWRER
ncbi:MAG: SDR family oxidoreductase [Acidobacteriota bacterium]